MNVIEELEDYFAKYSGEKGIFGKSWLGKDLRYFKVEKTAFPVVIAQYAIHAREYVTSLLAIKHIEYYQKNGRRGTVYFIPLMNPDGVKICLEGNKRYKANARGVDLNVNFPARWGTGKNNVNFPSSENYIGEYPLSEKESAALCEFTLKIRPDATLSFHSKGEEIYYEFFQEGETLKRDRNIAARLAEDTGYAVKSTPFSAGGYKDWCVQTLKIPSFTIEVGSDRRKHPLGRKSLQEIYRKTKTVVNLLTEII